MADGQITVLVENTANRGGLLAEHGLSFWVEFGSRQILFDTGQSDIVFHNAQVLGVDLSQVDAVVLSHGHYDHVGGLKRVIEVAPAVPGYFHPDALQMKFTCRWKQTREIGMDRDVADMLKLRIEEGLGSYTSGPVEIFPGVWVTGQIPRRSAFENTGGPFYADSDCTRPDELLDDQAIVLETNGGLVIVLGCSHAGVVNTLDYVSELFPDRPIRMVLGGMHLVRASRERITHTIEAFRRHRVEKIGPVHCTGAEATRELCNTLSRRCFVCNVGAQVAL
jgi:7,8-dihydropterin-6-yl-methyl-4-(beta-D-ribofuranosyl)aminobenzene 5'-phosphate synthase